MVVRVDTTSVTKAECVNCRLEDGLPEYGCHVLLFAGVLRLLEADFDSFSLRLVVLTSAVEVIYLVKVIVVVEVIFELDFKGTTPDFLAPNEVSWAVGAADGLTGREMVHGL